MHFTLASSTQVIFEKGAVRGHSAVLAGLGKHALVVTGRSSSRKNQALEDTVAALASAGTGCEVFSGVDPNPGWELVEAGASAGRKAGADFVIGVGGGSTLDASKAMAALLAQPGLGVADLYRRPVVAAVPVAAVPTTAGTGSEVTPYAVLTRLQDRTKRALNSPWLIPRVAFLDAAYTATLPAEVARDAAVDAWSHLIEGYVSTHAHPVTDALAEKGFRLFRDCLPMLPSPPWDVAVREQLLLASLLAGWVIAAAGTTTVHALGYPLTTLRGVPHGRANGYLLAAHLRRCQQSTAHAKVETFLTASGFGSFRDFEEQLARLLPAPSAMNQEELRDFAAIAIQSRNHENNPYPVDETILSALLAESLGTVS